MSRHHILPPLVYSPPLAKPKQAKRRRGVSGAQGAAAAQEADETVETAPTGRSAMPRQQLPVEATERRPPSPTGKLSEDTLKVMLQLQEQDAPDDAKLA